MFKNDRIATTRGKTLMFILALVFSMTILFSLVSAQFDSVKSFRGSITIGSTDDCMISVSENITLVSSSYGVTSFERKIPTTDLPLKYVWVHTVKATIVGTPPTGFKISDLKVFKIDVTSTATAQVIAVSFSALDSLPKSTVLNIVLSYKMLGTIGFISNTTDTTMTTVNYPLQFSIPVESVFLSFTHADGLSSVPIEPYIASSKKTFPSSHFTLPANQTVEFNTTLVADELLKAGFNFQASSYTMCYIPYNLMESWLIGTIIGASFAIPVIFFTICIIVTIIRFFTVDRKKEAPLLEAHRV
ncbi:predicted protein [Naegleria gruberi]|uniref:Predicted protein n=1 Tax=Naegleria gruberi TaxID=5762 RepID=D2V2F0_NAEGR|nr:uncharacterized protein NAEGRDRAFT_62978 [Naegleria gruberi]EFC49046.1 predicted protein [Naegleria gruberi]|eukprot:XP_002681790.1 predicted protein [Naegleria gruberi strain NEG-M]